MSQNSVMLGGIVVIAIVAVALILGAFMFGAFPSGTTTTTQTSQTGCSPNGCVRKLPIHFIFHNLYTNQPITDSVTATIFKGPMQADSATILNGVWDSTKADFTSGDSYSMYVTSGNSKYEFNIQVPLAQNLTQARFQITLNMALIGTYAISILGPDGVTPITSGYNVTSGICNGVIPCKASQQPTFTVTITNSVDNTGFTGTFERNEIPENGGVRKLAANALVVTVSGQNGNPAKLHTLTPVVTLPDHAVDKHRLQDGSLDGNAKGTYTTTLVFDASGMAPSSVETVTVTYWAYISLDYYSANQTINSEAVALASIQFLIQT